MPRALLPAFYLALLLAGCKPPAAPVAPPKPPEVEVEPVVMQTVTDFEEFTGRAEASETVEVRSHVTGYLDRTFLLELDRPMPVGTKDKYVREGSFVEKGDILFEIDPKLAQAEVERAAANLVSAQAREERLQDDYDRFRKLPPNSVSPTEMGKVEGDLKEAKAAVKSALAALNSAKVSREYCIVRAPIAGRVSRRLIDPGNTVKADETALTYVTQLDPMYCFFDIDERTYLKLLAFYQERGLKPEQLRDLKVRIGLANEGDAYPREGHLNFVDTRVDPSTGSVWIRAVVANPKHFLTPGLFVRVRMPVGDPHQALLVPEKALATDQGQKFVYVIDDKNVADYRSIQIGDKHGDNREVIGDSVKPGERVVVKGLQRVRPGATVTVKERPAPANK